MNKIALFSVAAALLTGCCCPKCCDPDDPVVGNWAMYLPFEDMSAGSLIITRDAEGKPHAQMLLRWASPWDAKSCEINGDTFKVVAQGGHEVVEGRVHGFQADCTITGFGAKKAPFKAIRNPPIRPANTDDAVLGEPIDILKDGLDGFRLMGKNESGWSFKDGVLSNRVKKDAKGKRIGHYANIMTKRADFYDFQLEYDVRVPKDSNSGVYLRGRYEIQTLDSYGLPVDRHNMAAYYGRVAPCVAAEKPAGEWQHVKVTLYKRHLTVFLNGMKIIENAPVVGVTGGAIDANEFVPGPLYIQGDHSDADYRNMILRPAI